MLVSNRDMANALIPLQDLTADQIAEFLNYFLRHDKGVCADPGECAIAKYLFYMLGLRDHPNLRISVGATSSSVNNLDDHFATVAYVDLPWNVSEFIRKFDRGNYPALATEDSLKRALEAQVEQEELFPTSG